MQAFAASAGNPNILYAGGGLGSGSEGPFTGAGVFKFMRASSTSRSTSDTRTFGTR